jgi:multisubunit Na+/H+ antiporter MnhB subunit
MNQKIKLSVGLGCIVIVLGFMIFSIFNPGFAQWENKSIASFFINQGWRQLDATNTVCTIVWEYRGYDTLGEETILFTAAMGVFAIGAGLFLAEKIEEKKAASPPSGKNGINQELVKP